MFRAFNSIKLPSLSATTSTKKKLKNINVQKLSKILKCLDSDIESISSDDEIYFNQLVEPAKITRTQNVEPIDDDYIQVINDDINDNELIVNNHYMVDDVNGNELIVNNHYMVDDVDDKEKPVPTKKRTKNQQRSVEGRHRKNHRRNTALKMQRYIYPIRRKWYPRFLMSTIRRILGLYNIDYRHVKDDGEELLIGLKDQQAREAAQYQLPRNIFNRQSYFHYRKVFRR
jgi:hypothetical protein